MVVIFSYFTDFFVYVVLRKMFGDGVLGSLSIQIVEVARSVGATMDLIKLSFLNMACENAGFIVQQAIIVPPVVNDEDLKTLSS